MLDDDYTPMEFVVELLQKYFSKNIEDATQIMLQIHQKGRAICGTYYKDIAVTKMNQVMIAAQQAGHPLHCLCEPVGF
jgi:ATP-dependent Clp protease adaptor protein ClpS